MEDLVGTALEGFKIISVLGKGGMGIVYKAYDIKLDREVAIKMLNSKVLNKPSFVEKFKTEAKNQAKLGHPNIVTVYGFIEHEGVLGIVMEYVKGECLDKFIKREKNVHLEDAIFIFRQILLGMKYAHSRGFIHRDLKPSNIIITPDGVVKIMDFGISVSLEKNRSKSTGKKVGTIYYMSPEQIEGGHISIRTDIYSLGCTFYEMVTGDPPFVFPEENLILDAHLNSQPRLTSKRFAHIPEIVDLFLARALVKDPIERYQDCEEFLYALREMEQYIFKMKKEGERNKEKKKKNIKVYSIVGAAVTAVIFLLLSYFIFTQAYTLVESGELDKLKKYDVSVLFSDSDNKLTFDNIETIDLKTAASINSIYSVGNTVITCSDSGSVFIYNVSNKSTSRIDPFSKISLNDIAVLNSGRSFIVGDSTVLVESSNFFNTFGFSFVDKYSDFSLQSIYFTDDLRGFITGTSGLILATDNGGITWERRNTPTSNTIYDISFSNKQKGFAIGWAGTMLVTNNGGYSWDEFRSLTNKYLKSIDFYGNDGIIVGGGGTILISNDGGENWESVSSNFIESLYKVKFIKAEQAIAVGAKGLILLTEDAGKSWNKINIKSYITFYDLAFNSSGEIFVAGVNGTIIHIRNN